MATLSVLVCECLHCSGEIESLMKDRHLALYDAERVRELLACYYRVYAKDDEDDGVCVCVWGQDGRQTVNLMLVQFT